jgi:hypothetical protein
MDEGIGQMAADLYLFDWKWMKELVGKWVNG